MCSAGCRDLERWAQVVARFLAPGGIFYIVEVHPVLQLFNERVKEPALRLLHPYFHGSRPPVQMASVAAMR